MSVRLRDLRALIVLSEERHFGRAAERLGVLQPQLSELVARVEAWAGVRLFTRRPKVAPTAAGEVLIETSRRVLAEIQHGLDEARRTQDGRAGAVRVGVVPTVMLTELPVAFDAFRRDHPDVLLTIQEMSAVRLVEALRTGRIDVALSRDPPADPALPRAVVWEEPFVAVFNEADAPDEPVCDPTVLASRALVLFPRRMAPAFHDQLLRVCTDAGFTPRIEHEPEGWPSTLALVRAGFGASFGPACLRRLSWPGLAFRDLASERTTRISAFRRAGASPSTEAFVRALA
jgi:DNA-binding transcriptional LysR family regulator